MDRVYDQIFEVHGGQSDLEKALKAARQKDPTAEAMTIEGRQIIGCSVKGAVVMAKLKADRVTIHKTT